MLGVGVVGAGYWGKNLIRTFADLPGARLVRLCDSDESRRALLARQYPGVRVDASLDAMLQDPDVGAAVIATPSETHAAFAVRALAAGKHVFVEKPLALSIVDAARVADAARRSKAVLMVGHLMVHHPSIDRIASYLADGLLGDVRYLYSQRVNLGQVRCVENALWSFAPHDVSVALRLVNETPVSVSAQGACYLQKGIEDVVFLTMRFPSGILAHAHMSWLDPHKIRSLTIVGTKKMVVFDDVHPREKIRIYDCGVDRKVDFTTYAEWLSIREGDITIPQVPLDEPLRRECAHFVACASEGRRPLTDAEDGLRVVRVLVAAERSLRAGGMPAPIET